MTQHWIFLIGVSRTELRKAQNRALRGQKKQQQKNKGMINTPAFQQEWAEQSFARPRTEPCTLQKTQQQKNEGMTNAVVSSKTNGVVALVSSAVISKKTTAIVALVDFPSYQPAKLTKSIQKTIDAA